jgi:hypothetical protein
VNSKTGSMPAMQTTRSAHQRDNTVLKIIRIWLPNLRTDDRVRFVRYAHGLFAKAVDDFTEPLLLIGDIGGCECRSRSRRGGLPLYGVEDAMLSKVSRSMSVVGIVWT